MTVPAPQIEQKPPPGQPAGGRPVMPAVVLATVALGVFVAADDLTVVSTMLRQIIFDLEIPLPEGLDKAAWIVNAYLIAYVVIMPFIGRVSDLIGRRFVYVFSMTLFMIGSIWIPAALPVAEWWLAQGYSTGPIAGADLAYVLFLVGRVLSALGGGAMVPVAMAIIADVYPPGRRASALGILGALETSGWVWGPLYGALLIRFLNWRWQFYLNVPLAIIGIVTGLIFLRTVPQPKQPARIDWLGAGLLTAGLSALNIGLLNSGSIQSVGALAELGTTDAARTLPFFAAAFIALLLFALVQRKRAAGGAIPPLIDLALFRRLNFTPAVVINFLVGGTLIIAMVNVPLVINVLEFDVAEAAIRSGWLLSAMTGAMALFSYVGGVWTQRQGYRPVTLTALGLCAVGLGLMGGTWEPAIPYSQMAIQLAVVGTGFGLVTAPIGAAIINAAPELQRGIASSLVIVFRLIGMSVGLSGLTAWGQYRFNLLRTQVDLPSITDPEFASALTKALTEITVGVLAETFLISAIVASLGIVLALRLRREPPEPASRVE